MKKDPVPLNSPIKLPAITELKKANPAFFKSFYSSPVAKAFISFQTYKYIEVNDKFLKLFECKRKQVIGLTADELNLWASSAQRKNVLKEYKKKKINTFNFDVKSLKGNVKNVIISTENIEINGENFLLGAILDNTEKFNYEKRLEESEEQYKFLFYKNPLPMWVFDYDTLKFISVNDSAIKHYGYSKSEFLKMKLTDIFPKEEVQKYLHYRETVITGNKRNELANAGIWKHKKKNGEIIDVEVTRTPVIFEGKKAILILANDVTTVIDSESKLRKKNVEMNLLYSSVKEISSTLNPVKIYEKIYKVVTKLIPCDGMMISSYDNQNEKIKCNAAWLNLTKLDVTKFPVLLLDKSGGGIQSKVIISGKSIIVNNFDKYARNNKSVVFIYKNSTIKKKLKKTDKINRSALVVPIMFNRSVVGVFQVLSYEKNAYKQEHLQTLEAFSAELSAAISNAHLFEQAQNEIKVRKETETELLRTSKEISTIYELSKDLSDPLKTKALFRKVFKYIKRSLPSSDIGISIFDPEKKSIKLEGLLQNGIEVKIDNLPSIKYDDTGKGIQSSVIKSRKTRIINDYKDYILKTGAKFYILDDGSVSYENDDPLNIAESALIVPLLYEGNILGTIQLLNFSKEPFTEDIIKMIEALASHIAVSYMNTKLYQQAQKEIEERSLKEEELSKIRKNLEEAQRISHLGSWEYDKKTNKIKNSEEVYRIIGVKPTNEGIDFEKAMNSVHEDDKDKTINIIKNAMLNNLPYVNEDRIKRPNGEIRYVKVMGEPVLDKSGLLIGMQGSIQDITDVKSINFELVKSLSDKELLLKEIHHRVKNNLQIVSSLLRLQAEKIKDNTVLEHFKMSEQRIKSMALIHQQLYRAKDFSNINFKEYLNELCYYLLTANDTEHGRIKFDIEAEELFFGIDTALPCGLIINELFTNAVKHAFPEGRKGNILLKLYKDNNDICHIEINDDGVGASKLDLKNTTSLGMELVNTLTDQLEGELSITVNNGTKIKLSFRELANKKNN